MYKPNQLLVCTRCHVLKCTTFSKAQLYKPTYIAQCTTFEIHMYTPFGVYIQKIVLYTPKSKNVQHTMYTPERLRNTPYPLSHTMEIPISVTSCNENPYIRDCRRRAGNSTIRIRYCLQWKTPYPLLRTMKIPTSVAAYNGTTYIRYYVQ